MGLFQSSTLVLGISLLSSDFVNVTLTYQLSSYTTSSQPDTLVLFLVTSVGLDALEM